MKDITNTTTTHTHRAGHQCIEHLQVQRLGQLLAHIPHSRCLSRRLILGRLRCLAVLGLVLLARLHGALQALVGLLEALVLLLEAPNMVILLLNLVILLLNLLLLLVDLLLEVNNCKKETRSSGL